MTGLRRAWRSAALAAGIAASAAAPAFAQRLGQAAAEGPSPWRVAAALALCILLAIGGALALRARLRGGWTAPPGWRLPLRDPGGLFAGSPRRLRLIETLRLSHQVDICLFSFDERQFVVAATPHGATVVTADAARAGAEAAP